MHLIRNGVECWFSQWFEEENDKCDGGYYKWSVFNSREYESLSIWNNV